MTPEAQRIAIAKACGWNHIYKDFGGAIVDGWFPPHVVDISVSNLAQMNGECPDYLNDLNAIHEAERTALVVFKDGVKWRDYRNEYKDLLWTICAPSRSGEETGWGFPDFSTAAQRAEAFLKTLGLWKE